MAAISSRVKAQAFPVDDSEALPGDQLNRFGAGTCA
jgi:hypothetical protein